MKRKLSSILIVFVIAFILVSCSNSNQDNDSNNLNANDTAQSKDFILIDDLNTIKMINKQNNQEDTFIKNPFDRMKVEGQVICIFSDNENFYYAVRRKDNNGFEVHKVNVETFDDIIIYKKSIRERELFGIAVNSIPITEPPTINSFLAADNKLIIKDEYGIYFVNLSTFKSTQIILNSNLISSDMSYHENKLYFISDDYKLMTYSFHDKKLFDFNSIITSSFMIKNNKLYYKDLKNKGILCCYDYESEKTNSITKDSVDCFSLNNDAVFYTLKKNPKKLFAIYNDIKKCIFEGNVYEIMSYDDFPNVLINTDGEGTDIEQRLIIYR